MLAGLNISSGLSRWDELILLFDLICITALLMIFMDSPLFFGNPISGFDPVLS